MAFADAATTWQAERDSRDTTCCCDEKRWHAAFHTRHRPRGRVADTKTFTCSGGSCVDAVGQRHLLAVAGLATPGAGEVPCRPAARFPGGRYAGIREDNVCAAGGGRTACPSHRR